MALLNNDRDGDQPLPLRSKNSKRLCRVRSISNIPSLCPLFHSDTPSIFAAYDSQTVVVMVRIARRLIALQVILPRDAKRAEILQRGLDKLSLTEGSRSCFGSRRHKSEAGDSGSVRLHTNTAVAFRCGASFEIMSGLVGGVGLDQTAGDGDGRLGRDSAQENHDEAIRRASGDKAAAADLSPAPAQSAAEAGHADGNGAAAAAAAALAGAPMLDRSASPSLIRATPRQSGARVAWAHSLGLAEELARLLPPGDAIDELSGVRGMASSDDGARVSELCDTFAQLLPGLIAAGLDRLRCSGAPAAAESAAVPAPAANPSLAAGAAHSRAHLAGPGAFQATAGKSPGWRLGSNSEGDAAAGATGYPRAYSAGPSQPLTGLQLDSMPAGSCRRRDLHLAMARSLRSALSVESAVAMQPPLSSMLGCIL